MTSIEALEKIEKTINYLTAPEKMPNTAVRSEAMKVIRELMPSFLLELSIIERDLRLLKAIRNIMDYDK